MFKISLLIGYLLLFPALNGHHEHLTFETINKADKPLKAILDSLKINPKTVKIIIVKSTYELSIWSENVKVKAYHVVFGQNPINDKFRQGDMCTPEGIFKIKSKYPHANWSKFMWIDYPTAESWKKHNEAISKGLIPASAKIGGEIGIHGVPKDCDYVVDNKQNWTWGCISLKNKDVNEIYEVVSVGTVVEIKK
jgi:murein L,D-transpeptidase YafK